MKYSRRFAGIVAVALIAVPFISSALTLDELNQQISALLSQVAALQQRIAGQSQASVPTGTQTISSAPSQYLAPTPASSGFCPQLSRALGIGTRGDDVYSLQHYLVSQQLLSPDSTTGFYGALTQAAVQNWQSSRGVVSSGDAATTGFGVVGARTRSMIALNCSIASNQPTTIAIAPTAEPACRVANQPASSCSTGWKAIKDTAGCTVAYDCATPLPTVTPTIPTSSFNLTASPISGSAPLTVTFTAVSSDSSEASGVYYTITYGDGTAGGFARGVNPVLSHTYSKSDTYTATVTRRTQCGSWECIGSSTTVGSMIISVGELPYKSCPIYMIAQCPAGTHREVGATTYDANQCPITAHKCVPDTQSTQFSASPTSGFAPLDVAFYNFATGGMFISSMYPIIDFGDGSAVEKAGACYAPSDFCITPGKNIHTYASNGTYTATLKRVIGVSEARSGDPNLYETLGTATISVGKTSTVNCPQYMAPLCSDNQHLVSGAYDSTTGCYGSPQCVAGASASADQGSNLANVLTALESILKKILGR